MSDNHTDSDASVGKTGESDVMPGTWGSFRITERLCRGALSSIFRAHDSVLDRDIALQLFHTDDDADKQRLLDEGRVMAGIRHPNIVQVLGAEEHDGVVGLKMQLIEGQSLRSMLEQQGPADAAETIVIGRQLCAALAAIHNAGLPHRPLDLSNVIRDPDGGIRLMGICSNIDQAGIAPEISEGTEPGPLSDIYALGVLLYRLSTGGFPPPADAADLTDQLHDCLDRAVADDPRLRYATPGRFAKALSRAGRRPPSRARRIAGIMIILTLAVLVILQWPSQYRVNSDWYLLGADGSRIRFASGDALITKVAGHLFHGFGDLPFHHHGGQGIPVADAFAHGHDVRLDTVVLVSEPFSGAPYAGGHFVDQDQPVAGLDGRGNAANQLFGWETDQPR